MFRIDEANAVLLPSVQRKLLTFVRGGHAMAVADDVSLPGSAESSAPPHWSAFRMDGKRKTRTTSTRRGGRLARWVAALALGALAVVVFLPAFVTGQVNRILHGLMASGVAEFRLVHAGLFRSDVAIAFDDGGPEGPPLEVASCSLAYRPQSLLAGHIDAVSLGGVVLRVVATNAVVAIPAVEFFAPPAASAAPSRAFSLKRLRELPVTVDRVRLAGHIVAQIDGETLVIPVKAEAAIQNDAGWDAIDASLRLRFSTSAIDVAARCSPADESISAQVRARIAADGLPAVLRTRLPDALRCAAADVTAQATASFDGAALPHFAIEVQADAKAETERLAFALHPVLKAAGNRDRVDASLTGLAADVGGVRIALDATNVVASLAEQSLDGTLAIAIATNAPLALVFHASPCDFAVGFGEGGAPWSGGVAAEGFEVACEGLRLEARGTRDSATGEAAGGAVLALDGLAIRDAEGRLVAETGPGGITNAIAVSTKAARAKSPCPRPNRRFARSPTRDVTRSTPPAPSHRRFRPRPRPSSAGWNSPDSRLRSSRRRPTATQWPDASARWGWRGRCEAAWRSTPKPGRVSTWPSTFPSRRWTWRPFTLSSPNSPATRSAGSSPRRRNGMPRRTTRRAR